MKPPRSIATPIPLTMTMATEFYGDRLVRGANPRGNQLFIASNVTDVDRDGLMKRVVPLR